MSIIFDSFKTGSSEKADGYQTSGLSFAGLLDSAQQSFKLTNDVIGSASASAVLPGLELTDVGRATASIGEIGAVANPANLKSFLEGDKRDGGQGSFELSLNPVLPPARLLNRLENVVSGGDDVPSIPTPWSDEPLSGTLPRPYVPISGALSGRFLDNKITMDDPVNFPPPGIRWDDPTRPGDQLHKPGDGSDKPKDPVDNVLDKLSKDDLKNLVKQLLQDRQNQQPDKHHEQQQPHNVVEELLKALQRMFQQQQHSDQPTVVRVPKNGRGSERPQAPEEPAEQPEQPAERPEHSPEQYRAAVKAMEYFQANKERLKNLGKGVPPTEQEMKDLSENLSALKAVGWENELKSTGLSSKFLDAAVTVFAKGSQTTSSDIVVPSQVDMPSTNHAPNPAPIYA